MTIESGIALAFATFVFACIPGPGVAALVAQSLSRGFRAGIGYAAGLVCGDLVYLLTALWGLGWISAQVGPWFVVLKWAGAAYLVFMGIRAWRAVPPIGRFTDSVPPRSGQRSFAVGLCVSLGNPKVIAFYCGFLPGFVDLPTLTGAEVLVVVSLIIPTVFTVLSLYAWLSSQGRTAIRSTRVWKTMHRIAGSVMIGAGVAVAAE
ncbi:LysE family transporter [Pseudodesulfovibrio sp. JC047]|uniref:LysE family translocator n=1 Tax=Pseudodesulfovibrio sp. JC047 TaxID=2683199 RepID=UPI0013CF9360|nr:LysE family translocator [Pseudodesulfovibrio sp. JC047]NDV20787.1 LysE family transporter [Pseudodesulfovibrio sp. JC047]